MHTHRMRRHQSAVADGIAFRALVFQVLQQDQIRVVVLVQELQIQPGGQPPAENGFQGAQLGPIRVFLGVRCRCLQHGERLNKIS